MAIFYERVPHAPYIWMECLIHNAWYQVHVDVEGNIKQEALLSFYNVFCSTFELFFRKNNIFSDHNHNKTLHDFFFWEILRRNPLSTFKMLVQNNCPAISKVTWSPCYICIFCARIRILCMWTRVCMAMLSIYRNQPHVCSTCLIVIILFDHLFHTQ